MNGSNDYMNPESNLNRAEAAKIIYTLLENPLEGEEGSSFADVPAGIWYEDYVNSMAAMGLIEGYDGNVYEPDSFITRAEFVTILSRVYLPEEDQEDIAFSDVSSDHWAYDALKNAVARGWLKGYDGNTLKPEGNITRTEAILVLNRMLGRSPDKDAIDGEGKILQYLDVPYGYWAYYDIMEASVPHEHSAAEDGSEVIAITLSSKLSGTHACAVKAAEKFKYVFPCFCVIGALTELELVWTIQDIALGLLTLPNLVALVFLAPQVRRATKEFFNEI